MGVEGLEPSRPIDQQILSLLCLPFHHTPTIFKATPRFELGIEDLQSTALPLGHIALLKSYRILPQIDYNGQFDFCIPQKVLKFVEVFYLLKLANYFKLLDKPR